jgi:CRP-like cAMP-binding protein
MAKISQLPFVILTLLCSWDWLGLIFSSCRSVSVLALMLSFRVESDGTEVIDTADDNEWVNLDELTDAELEKICINHGFELLREEVSGESGDIIYNHKYYVEAAEQCLAIAEEMEKVLQENPDMLQQLVEEVARLEKRKVELEEALDRMENSTTLDTQTLAFIKSIKLQTHNLSDGKSKASSSALMPKSQVSTVSSSAITVYQQKLRNFGERAKESLTYFLAYLTRKLYNFAVASMGFSSISILHDTAPKASEKESGVYPTCDMNDDGSAE